MNLKQLEYFISVANEESFSKASKKLYVSQPNISKSIQSLEESIGVKLFDRYPRKVMLNRFGEYFYNEVKKAIDILNKSEDTIKEMVDPFSGTINLSFIHTLGGSLVPSIISEYNLLYPNVQFHLFQGSTDVLLDNLLSGGADFCFLMDRKFPPEIKYQKLFSETLYAALPKNHPLANLQTIDLKALKNEHFINFKFGIGLRNSIDTICRNAGFNPEIKFECQEVGTVAGFVEAGLGVSLIPKLKGISSYEIVLIPVRNRVKTRNINLAFRTDSYKSPAVNQFHNFLKKKFNIH